MIRFGATEIKSTGVSVIFMPLTGKSLDQWRGGQLMRMAFCQKGRRIL
jgi:hypothetical protein